METRTRRCRRASRCCRNWRNRLPLRGVVIWVLPHLVALFQVQMASGPGRQMLTRQEHEAHKDDQFQQKSPGIDAKSAHDDSYRGLLLEEKTYCAYLSR